MSESDVKNVKARDKTSERFAEFEKNWKSELARIEKLNEKIKAKRKSNNKVGSEKDEKKNPDDDLEKPSQRVKYL